MEKKIGRLAVVVPCYNEEEVLAETTKRLVSLLHGMVAEDLVTNDSYVLYVNDGSTDGTWKSVCEQHEENAIVMGVSLAGNVGHQNALMAGLEIASKACDMAVSIDADLQDNPEAIREMVLRYNEGYDIVYGVRSRRDTDTFFKRTTAQLFYRMMNVMGAKSVYNHADFRLMSCRAIMHLMEFRERNIFLRGMVPLVGYRSTNVYYERMKRFAGESKYPLKRMIAFALDGITSFSIKPVHLVFYLGVMFLLIALGILCWVLYAYNSGHVVPGWSSLMISIWFCSGCVLIGLGVVGEYIGKIYMEVKGRPRYNIESVLMNNGEGVL